MTDQTRVVVLGTGGHFTTQVLKHLFEHGMKPQAYIQWADTKQRLSSNAFGIPVEVKKPPDELADLLAQHRVESANRATDLPLQLDELAPDFLLVACWPVLIDPQSIRKARKAALNIHPSLLPKYRGFDPIGDQLKQAEKQIGVSLHLLNNEYDCGDIVAQSEVFPKNTTSRQDIENACAKKAVELFIEASRRYHKPGWILRAQNAQRHFVK